MNTIYLIFLPYVFEIFLIKIHMQTNIWWAALNEFFFQFHLGCLHNNSNKSNSIASQEAEILSAKRISFGQSGARINYMKTHNGLYNFAPNIFTLYISQFMCFNTSTFNFIPFNVQLWFKYPVKSLCTVN